MQIAWRNVWRNPRRTWLTTGAIAFAIFLIVFARATQIGSFDTMIESTTGFMTGHIQVQHSSYKEDPVLKHVVGNKTPLLEQLQSTVGIAYASARLQTFALVSVDEKSAGALVMGVDPANEKNMFRLADSLYAGRYLENTQELVMGRLLARNLGAQLGDEVVLLGSQLEGGVAALVVKLVGLFDTGQTELDRGMLQIPYAAFQEGFGLKDDAHLLAIRLNDFHDADKIANTIRGFMQVQASEQIRVYTWQELMPEIQQSIDMKLSSSKLFFGMLVLMVTFSIVNTYIMTVVERTPEFGMLIAIGMRPWSIVWLLSLEALFVSLLGIVIGLAISGVLVGILSRVGIPLPQEAAELLRQFHMPDRFYPEWSWRAALQVGLLMFASTQTAALFSTLRVRKLVPAAAMHVRN